MSTSNQTWKVALIFLALFTCINLTGQSVRETVFTEDFELGWGSWWADNGGWDVGIPTAGPDAVHSGQNCAGTVLDGNYADHANTRLISPSITLPAVSEEESIQLKFWQWFSIENGDDQGYIQISVDGGDWETISDVEIDGGNPCWSQYVADLTSYAGSSVRIGFYFTADNYQTYTGWYIDDVSIETGVVTFPNPEDFESGVGSWSADNGLWEVGVPIVGPSETHSGTNCIGTHLDGNYADHANTRLISPSIALPAVSDEETIQLKFWQWFSIENGDDQGYVQISVDGGDWETISDVEIDGGNPCWSQYVADLTPYAGSSVRIGFYLTADNYQTYTGWYIDDVSIETGVITFPNPEDFESGVGSWSADNGLWEVGMPIVGPSETHSGTNCIGTHLDGNYADHANTRLISPSTALPGVSDEETIQLKFWQWFSIENGDDQGYVQISVDGGDWETISDVEIDGGNPCWSQYVADITPYAGSSVRIGFYLTADNYQTYTGWYIDDVSIETGVVTFPNPEDFESGVGSWSADNGLWEVGVPIVGPSETHSGTNCIGTHLDGNYADHANTRLISPSSALPAVSDEETIQLKFWQWFSIENGDDQGYVQISVDGGDWETISDVQIDGGNPCWSQYVADLTPYAGSSVRIGFYLTADNYQTYTGWYIDDVSIETGVVTFPNPEDFESGVGSWSADNGLWEVGVPIVGPSETHSGTNCLGTHLDGNYADHANTRLISPEIKLNPITGQFPMLFFYQWFSIENGDDKGYVQILVKGGEWQTVSDPITGGNDTWSQYGLNLTDYTDSIIRIGFYLTSDNYQTYSGWYIDDIRIEGIVTGVDDSPELNPNDLLLGQNSPNPFNSQTIFKYNLSADEDIQLNIYNLNGDLVKTLVNKKQNQGEYSIRWDGKNEYNHEVSPGIYYYSLKTRNGAVTKKMVLIK